MGIVDSCSKPFLSCVLSAWIFLLFGAFIRSSKYMFDIFTFIYSYFTGLLRRLDSSVGRALHRHRKGHGFESRSSLNFFQAFFSQLLKLCTNCEDYSSIWEVNLPHCMLISCARTFSAWQPRFQIMPYITRGGRALHRAWHFFCIWIIQQKLTSHPV